MATNSSPLASVTPLPSIKRKIFEEIADHIQRWGDGPSLRDLRHCFCGMTDDVDLHLEQLAKEGLIEFSADLDSPVKLRETFGAVPPIEIYASVPPRGSAGMASMLHGPIVLDLRSLGVEALSGLFGFPVVNDDMIDAGIRPGDIAIIANRNVSRGDIVVIEIDGFRVLRRYVIIAGIEHYLAENPLRPSLIPAYDAPIQGVLWHLVRTDIANPSIHKTTNYTVGTNPEPSSKIAGEVVWPPQEDETLDEISWNKDVVAGLRKTAKGRAKKGTQTQRYDHPKASLPPLPWVIGLNDPSKSD